MEEGKETGEGKGAAIQTQTDGRHRPLVVGFGPCGIFAAYVLAKAGLRPIVLERGKAIEARGADVTNFWQRGLLNEDSNVLFGEGGAGAFSDGKLTTGLSDPRKHFVLHTLVDAGGGEDLLYLGKPHIGTDVLRDVVGNLRREILGLGGEIRFGNRLVGVETDRNGRVTHAMLEEGESIPFSQMILAIGHSARDTVQMLYDRGLSMAQKPFSMGFRIEHAQAMIDENQYGREFQDIYGFTITEGGLPRAEYKLSHRCGDGRGVYTFCMCPGGTVIPVASEAGGICTNGMSNRARDSGFANSAVLADVPVSDFGSDHPLAGLTLQREIERRAYEISSALSGSDVSETTMKFDRQSAEEAHGYRPLTETIGRLATSESLMARCLPSTIIANLLEALPHLGRKLKGFDDASTRIYGPETRSSSPLRIWRGQDFQSNIRGLYPCGEGAGFAGGIMSAAIDGIRVAEAVIHARFE
jgi:uncharacterized FAD-dependent dehydrogenase